MPGRSYPPVAPVVITRPVMTDPELFRRLAIAHSVTLRDEVNRYFELLPRYAAMGDEWRTWMCEQLLRSARDELERYSRLCGLHTDGAHDVVPF